MATALMILAVSLGYYGYYVSTFHAGTQDMGYKVPPDMIGGLENITPRYITPGGTFQAKVTEHSGANKSIAIMLKLKLTFYNNEIWSSAVPQETVVNYTFTPNSLIVEPYGTNSSILTMSIAEDAPPGRYLFAVKVSSTQETGQLLGEAFSLIVQPRANATDTTRLY